MRTLFDPRGSAAARLGLDVGQHERDIAWAALMALPFNLHFRRLDLSGVAALGNVAPGGDNKVADALAVVLAYNVTLCDVRVDGVALGGRGAQLGEVLARPFLVVVERLDPDTPCHR